jgi:nucleotide-binding universal stress UspA family protein
MSSATANNSKRPFAVVLGVDLDDTESSGFAFDQAARIVARIPGAVMHILHVQVAETSAATVMEAAGLLRLYITEKAAMLGEASPTGVGIHVRRGDAAKEIAQLAADVSADMIVVGSHKAPHLKSLFVGSTAERVMAASKCPVFVAGPRPHPQPSHTIVIEAACPDCLTQRAATQGKSWWCPRHTESHHLRRHHAYSYQSALPFESHDQEVSATSEA